MTTYFIQAFSFPNPIAEDETAQHVEAESPEAALEKLVAEYEHPAGLLAALAWASDDDYNDPEAKPLLEWLSSEALAREQAGQEHPHQVGRKLGQGTVREP